MRARIGRGAGTALLLAAAVLSAGLIGAGPAAAARAVEVPAPGPGPAELDHVTVHKFGPRGAGRVLVLMPGTSGGAGDFTLLARDLVRRVPGLQVWSVDRRSQPLEDTAMFEAALAGEATLQEAFDYYLGWLGGATPPERFQFLDPSTVPFAKRWGMEVALEDVRRVVREARKRGRRVLLGGHSLGASLAAAYAAWDFRGRPGFRGLDGIVLIDGGLLGSFVDRYTKKQAEAQLATLDEEPFLDLLGTGIPDTAGVFAEIGGIFARLDPTGDAATLRDFFLLPAEFRPPVPVTNRAMLGYAFDRDTSPQSLGLLHMNAGELAAAGDPRDWADGGVTPVANIARTFGQEPANAVEWYFPRRLTIDTDAANAMRRNKAARLLGLRLKHTRAIDVPVYAFQTDLTDGSVLKGARRLIRKAETGRRESMLIDGDPRFSHLDPLTADPERNRFARSVARFIRRATR